MDTYLMSGGLFQFRQDNIDPREFLKAYLKITPAIAGLE